MIPETGVALITREREEQITKHNRTVIADVAFNNQYQLSVAAIGLIQSPMGAVSLPPKGWEEESWKKMQGKSYKERLIIAGALIAAEIDRVTVEETKNE